MTGSRAGVLISEDLEQAINAQVGREFGASLQYVSIASHFDGESLTELAAFFFRQAEEEKEHAMKLVRYILEAGGHVRIPPVDGPKSDFATAEEAVGLALEWETEVTRQINHLMDVAKAESDYIAQNFLQWFVAEQLEEVSSMSTMLDVVRRAGPAGLLHVEEFVARMPDPHAGEGA